MSDQVKSLQQPFPQPSFEFVERANLARVTPVNSLHFELIDDSNLESSHPEGAVASRTNAHVLSGNEESAPIAQAGLASKASHVLFENEESAPTAQAGLVSSAQTAVANGIKFFARGVANLLKPASLVVDENGELTKRAQERDQQSPILAGMEKILGDTIDEKTLGDARTRLQAEADVRAAIKEGIIQRPRKDEFNEVFEAHVNDLLSNRGSTHDTFGQKIEGKIDVSQRFLLGVLGNTLFRGAYNVSAVAGRVPMSLLQAFSAGSNSKRLSIESAIDTGLTSIGFAVGTAIKAVVFGAALVTLAASGVLAVLGAVAFAIGKVVLKPVLAVLGAVVDRARPRVAKMNAKSVSKEILKHHARRLEALRDKLERHEGVSQNNDVQNNKLLALRIDVKSALVDVNTRLKQLGMQETLFGGGLLIKTRQQGIYFDGLEKDADVDEGHRFDIKRDPIPRKNVGNILIYGDQLLEEFNAIGEDSIYHPEVVERYRGFAARQVARAANAITEGRHARKEKNDVVINPDLKGLFE